MLLDYLRYFSWYNEPQNVRFIEEGMEIETLPQTEFWQHGIFQQQDNGHFFYTKQNENFKLKVCWQADDFSNFAQCGIMLRKDEKNWFKAAVAKLPNGKKVLCSSLTINGYSDWVEQGLTSNNQDFVFDLQFRNNDCIVHFNTNTPVRMFHFKGEEIKAGAYICSPSKQYFQAKLTDMDLI